MGSSSETCRSLEVIGPLKVLTSAKRVPPELRAQVVLWSRGGYQRDGVVPTKQKITELSITLAQKMGFSWSPSRKWLDAIRAEASTQEEVAAQPTR